VPKKALPLAELSVFSELLSSSNLTGGTST